MVNITLIKFTTQKTVEFYNAGELIFVEKVTAPIAIGDLWIQIGENKFYVYNLIRIQEIDGTMINYTVVDRMNSSLYLQKLQNVWKDFSGLIKACCCDSEPTYVGQGALFFEFYSEFPYPGQTGVIYVAQDTSLSYWFDGTEYHPLSPILFAATYGALPVTGDENVLYVVRSLNTMYIWNTTTLMYDAISGAGGGAVSISLSMPTPVFNVSGSPASNTGSFDVTFKNQSPATVFAGPTSGSPAAPTFRPLSAGDIPSLPYYSNTNPSGYLNASSANLLYYPLSSNPSGYLTSASAGALYYPLSSNPAGYLTANQSITLSGDVTGTGATSIATSVVWANSYTTLDLRYERLSNKGAANGYAPLGSDSKIPNAYLPALAISDTYVVGSQSAMLALSAETGDIAIRTDLSKSFILQGSNPAVLANWQELLSPTFTGITSINGFTGPSVTLTTSDITEGTNLYYTNARVQTFGDARYVQLSGSYTNPSWITSLDAGKITGAPWLTAESDTLGTVVARGATTSSMITVGGITNTTHYHTSQITDPAGLASNNTFWADTSGYFGFRSGTGFAAKLSLASLTSDRVFTLPDVAGTLAPRNTATAGSYTNANITIDAHGRITAASNGSGGGGGVSGSGTATRIAFWDTASSISSSANLYWDNTNSRLAIRTTTPTSPTAVLHVGGSATGFASLNIEAGTAPTSPNANDFWTTSTGFFMRQNSVTTAIMATANSTSAVTASGNVLSASLGSGTIVYGRSLLNTSTSGSNIIVFGHSMATSVTTGSQIVAIGTGPTFSAASTRIVYIGTGLPGSLSDRTVTIGYVNNNTNGLGSRSVLIGDNATANVSQPTASVGIGADAAISASNQLVIGGVNAGTNTLLTDCLIGGGDQTASISSATTITWRLPNSVAVSGNVNGHTLRIEAGKATGSGTPGDIILRTGTTSGSPVAGTVYASADRVWIKGSTGYVGIGVAPSTAAFLTLNASSSAAPIRFVQGTPSSPNDGDMWYDGTNVYLRVGASTKTFTLV